MGLFPLASSTALAMIGGGAAAVVAVSVEPDDFTEAVAQWGSMAKAATSSRPAVS